MGIHDNNHITVNGVFGGDMDMSALPLGSKNKYKRMDSELTDGDDDSHHHHQLEDRRKTTRKFVLACAIFASLNNVLLGYGKFSVSPFDTFTLLNGMPWWFVQYLICYH